MAEGIGTKVAQRAALLDGAAWTEWLEDINVQINTCNQNLKIALNHLEVGAAKEHLDKMHRLERVRDAALANRNLIG